MNKKNRHRKKKSQSPQGGRVRRTHKDSLFHILFGEEKYKANALELYNAINGTDCQLEDLEITTLEDVIYMGVKNDASLIVGNELSLWEHQSSYNPNMPLRGLIYFGRLYDGLVERRRLNLYSGKRQRIPTPRYYVFYNGEEDQPERSVLRLSDLYEGQGDIEITATMLDINEGRNREIMERCKALRDYARLIGLIREYNRKMDLHEAVDTAVDQCIEEGVLAEFLSHHRAEVKGMVLTEYDEKKTMEQFKKEWYEDGLADGRKEGWQAGLADGRKDSCTILSNSLMSEYPAMTAEEALKMAKRLLMMEDS